MLDITLPGTGGMMPLPNRWLASCFIEYEGAGILIDCGEGTQIAVAKAGVRASKIDAILITHVHADHISGLPGMLLTLANSDRTEPLLIYGPVGLARIVSSLMVITPQLPYKVFIGELKGGENVEIGGLKIDFMKLRHGIPCLGYRITLHRKPVFDPEKAAALNIPVKYYRALHAGNDVTLDDGRVIEPEQVLAGIRAPISVCYVTDTAYMKELSGFASGVDLLVCEGMYGDDAMADKAKDKHHMLFTEAASIARDANAGKLWLTHYSPSLTDPAEHLSAVRAVFAATKTARDGEHIEL